MTERIRFPRYGMVVTDSTGLWMLVTQRTPGAIDDERFVWFAWSLGEVMPFGGRLHFILLDPDVFGEVV